MIFKRKKKNVTEAAAEVEVTAADANDAAEAEKIVDTDSSAKSAPSDRATAGPYDATEVPAARPFIDMGGIKVAPREGLKVRLDVEEQSKRIIAVSLDYEGSTLQVQAFSAPKSSGLWHEARAQIMQTLESQGGKVAEQEGPFGPEVLLSSPPEAEQAAAVRFFGVDGPRWMLRGVLVGAGALNPEQAAGIESVFREIVVVRGEQPLPPNELLALKVPGNLGQASQTVEA